MPPSGRFTYCLFLPREDVFGESELVADGAHFFLHGVVDGHAGILALLPDVPFLFACGVDAVAAGGFLRIAERAADIAGSLAEFGLAE